MEIGLIDLLERCGFDPKVKTKLVRHRDARCDVESLRRIGWFDLYQGFQARPVFRDCEQVVSFVGVGGRHAKFIGVYDVAGQADPKSVRLPREFPDRYRDWRSTAATFYKLHERPNYEELQDRLVVDWGKGTLAWVQNLRDKPVVELLAAGRVREPFTDYQEFMLSYPELRGLKAAPEANREWQARLSAVCGIYLITATTTGQQYIGSARGAAGIWGRWGNYAVDGHGGNLLLKELVARNPDYPQAFQYSILHVLPPTTTSSEVFRWERIYKQKLGTRATGLNAN